MRSEARLAAAVMLLVLMPGAARADENDDSGPIIGFELGAAGAFGGVASAYRPGLGKALVLGWRSGAMAIEWHFAQSYGTEPSDERLRGDRTAGEISISSFELRWLFFGPRPLVWLGAGLPGDATMTGVSYTASTDDLSGVAFSLTLGLRYTL